MPLPVGRRGAALATGHCSVGGGVQLLAVTPTNAARRTMRFGVNYVGTKPMTSRRHHQENCWQVRRPLTCVLSC